MLFSIFIFVIVMIITNSVKFQISQDEIANATNTTSTANTTNATNKTTVSNTTTVLDATTVSNATTVLNATVLSNATNLSTSVNSEMSAALMLASLAGDSVPQDPSLQNHLSDSFLSDDKSQVSETRRDQAPSGLFGEAPDEDAQGQEQDVQNGGVSSGFSNQPGARPTTTSGKNRYQTKYFLAWEEISWIEGTEVVVGDRLDAIQWIVVVSVTDDEIGPDAYCGAKDKNFYKKIVGEAFLDMWPGDFDAQYEYLPSSSSEEEGTQAANFSSDQSRNLEFSCLLDCRLTIC